MPLPKLRDAEIAQIAKQIAEYIEQQRETYKRKAAPLDSHQKSAMRPFFPSSVLHSTRVLVLAGERVSNPPFYPQLQRMGFDPAALPNFAFMAAITLVDVVVSHEAFTDRLLFHELIHVVQYEKLGLTQFAAKYVTGFLSGGAYKAIPLEINAYELDARFAADPTAQFSVEGEVQRWIDAGKF